MTVGTKRGDYTPFAFRLLSMCHTLLVESHTLHNKILKKQAAVTEPMHKRLWQQIVQKKIMEQA